MVAKVLKIIISPTHGVFIFFLFFFSGGRSFLLLLLVFLPFPSMTFRGILPESGIGAFVERSEISPLYQADVSGRWP